MGASSSKRMGWLTNTSRARRQRERISCSVSCTWREDLLPRTSSSLAITLSTSMSAAMLVCVLCAVLFGVGRAIQRPQAGSKYPQDLASYLGSLHTSSEGSERCIQPR
mmetsp:Transcript_139535/g.197557  ORF Transcript_139535/g.197557 Transcript_139535/m.197557 type:complete len:108 (+) Transcript_139535:176-499(+)